MRATDGITCPLLWLVLLLPLIVLTTLSSVSWAAPSDAYGTLVRNQCGFTRYPILCVETLMPLNMGNGIFDDGTAAGALVEKTISETERNVSPPLSNLTRLVVGYSRSNALHANAVSDQCEELITQSLRRLRQSLKALRTSPVKSKFDIQTWLSAVITLQESCKDSANGPRPEVLSRPSPMDEISMKMDYLSKLASNSLALANMIKSKGSNTAHSRGDTGHEFPSWVTKRQRRQFQGDGSSGGGGIEANVVVAQDGSGDYTTVSDAISAASSHGGRFVIYVKTGVYKEKIHCKRDALTLIGDGKYSTIIAGDDSVASGSTLLGSTTFTITGDGFIARDIGFQNTAGPQGEQAVALTVASDRSVFYRCSLVGYQDTLYALALRQFYRECDIYGTIDFIFGNAAAIFQNCYLVIRKPGNRKAYNVILANGRSDPGQNTGFTVQNCKIVPGQDFAPNKHSWSSYLGRPWKYYSRSVIIESDIDDCIVPRGYIEWPGYGSSTYKSLYFAEYLNNGAGAGTGKRVNWPGFRVIGADEAVKFTVRNFIVGDAWIPSTGVSFISGLQ